MTALLSCETKNPAQDFPKISDQTIQTISKLVIDKICADTNLHLDHPLLISDSLYRFNLAKDPDSVREKDLLNYVIADDRFLDTIPFSKKDSAFLIVQEKQIATLKLDSTSCAKLRPIHSLETMRENYLKNKKYYLGGFFTLSIPVFSSDLKTAILTVEFNGFQIDSYYKQVFIVRQINNSWQILRTKSIAMA